MALGTTMVMARNAGAIALQSHGLELKFTATRKVLPLASGGLRWARLSIRTMAPRRLGVFASSDPPGGKEHQEFSAPKPPPSPEAPRNRVIGLVSAAAAICLFLSNRAFNVAPGLKDLAASTTPYDEALRNGKPTVVEFYADWCEVCREMARDVYSVEEKYKDRVNFVMVNVDNAKWETELDEFGVEGIPHFAFLDEQGNEEGNLVGKLPKKYLVENVEALVNGSPSIPHTRVVGKFSDAAERQPPRIVSPRAHS